MSADLSLCFAEAGEVARLIRAGELSPSEAVENALARIGEVNPKLNCFCFVWDEAARAAAKAAEDRLMRGGDLPPLLGVPIAFKDITPTKGQRTTLGSYAFEHWVPDVDAVVVERLTAAGAIVVGKTTTPEFAHAGVTHSPLWGVTRNPWDLARTPGGSSGGAGAAVASGCVPLAEGSDMGGSIRIPAALCGTVGLKPSFGRIPFEVLPSQLETLNHFGPLARSVADAARFLDAAQGPDPLDLSSLPERVTLDIPPKGELAGVKLAVSPDLGFYAVDAQVAAVFEAAVAALEEAGAVVQRIDLAWRAEIVERWYDLWRLFMASNFGHLLEEWRDKLDPTVVALIEEGRRLSGLQVKDAERFRSEMWRALAPHLAENVALLSPTCAVTAPLVGQRDEDLMGFTPEGRLLSLDMTCPINLVSQCPAISMPIGLANDGLPVGLQVVGRRYDDAGVLAVAAGVERVLGGFRRPPAFG